MGAGIAKCIECPKAHKIHVLILARKSSTCAVVVAGLGYRYIFVVIIASCVRKLVLVQYRNRSTY